MPKFSEYFSLGLSQHELDFVDVSNEYDTAVYVDPYAIEIRNDIWAAEASESIRIFFLEVLTALRSGNDRRAENLMSRLQEPQETFLGVSTAEPKGRGVGSVQASQLIKSIKRSKAYQSGLLSDLSEMSLYVEGIDRDKISDLTTNIIRKPLVEYTQQQCEIHGIQMKTYNGPPLWDNKRKNWVSDYVSLPYIGLDAVLLVPKYIVRRKLCLDSQEFYNKQITDFLIEEHKHAGGSLVQTLKSGERKVYKKDIREKHPRSKSFIAEIVSSHPELLDLYKQIAKDRGSLTKFDDQEGPSISSVCEDLIEALKNTKSGSGDADKYHKIMLGTLTALFYPDLIQPHKEWEIHDGRKRIDIVYTNAADTGFFAQRRNDSNTGANTVIVECKNYTNDIANQELDQLLGRFDDNRGKFGFITCRSVDDFDKLNARCVDSAARKRGYIIVLTDDDIISMLTAKAALQDDKVKEILYKKFRKLME